MICTKMHIQTTPTSFWESCCGNVRDKSSVSKGYGKLHYVTFYFFFSFGSTLLVNTAVSGAQSIGIISRSQGELSTFCENFC